MVGLNISLNRALNIDMLYIDDDIYNPFEIKILLTVFESVKLHVA